MCKIKNTLFKVNSKLDIMVEKISELEGIAIETIQNETRRTLELISIKEVWTSSSLTCE